MPPAQAKESSRRLVIHHLSDIHYQITGSNQANQALIKYNAFIKTLADDRAPTLVVVTGDLTASGAPDDLRYIAAHLASAFPRWQGDELQRRVVVVPGPRDLTWKKDEAPTIAPFSEAFSAFARPAGQAPADARTGQTPNCVLYPLDTCFEADDFVTPMTEQLKRQTSVYEQFSKAYRRARRPRFAIVRLWRRFRHAPYSMTAVRGDYLRLADSDSLTLLDNGRIRESELQAFEAWVGRNPPPARPVPPDAESAAPGAQADPSAGGRRARPTRPLAADSPDAPTSGEPPEPLRILVSHHAIIVPTVNSTPDAAPASGVTTGATTGAAASTVDISWQRFQRLAALARSGGFHLALHGHMHTALALSDLTTTEGTDAQSPLRQIGASSLGDHGTFNEIIAEYYGEPGQGQWRLEMRTINVLDARPDTSPPLILLNPSGEAASQALERLKDAAQRDRDFELQVSLIMRQFANDVFNAQADDHDKKWALPQQALLHAAEVVRKVIFPGYEPRIRVLLKDVESKHEPAPALVPRYLSPMFTDGPGKLIYPASIAAWSLILGRTLTFPAIQAQELSLDDIYWLINSGKRTEVQGHLERLQQHWMGASYPRVDTEPLRRLASKLTMVESGVVHGRDLYQVAPTTSGPSAYPQFVCVPYPPRPSGNVTPLPEVAILDIGVRAVSGQALTEQAESLELVRERERLDPLAQDARAAEKPAQPEKAQREWYTPTFTQERLRMLESLMEYIGAILITSSALERPKGVWDSRFRAR